MRLRVTLERAAGQSEARYALNDCVVNQGSIARLIDLEAMLALVPISNLVCREREVYRFGLAGLDRNALESL